MKLNKVEAQKAVEEIVALLEKRPEGLPTRELIGTPRFHGHRTLNSRQIHRILSGRPDIRRSYEGTGYMASSFWRLA
jgi:hypothetical protein